VVAVAFDQEILPCHLMMAEVVVVLGGTAGAHCCHSPDKGHSVAEEGMSEVAAVGDSGMPAVEAVVPVALVRVVAQVAP